MYNINAMELFKSVKDYEKSLREKSTDVELPLSEEYKTTLLNMLEYLKLSQDDEIAKKYHLRAGVGLAAPQIGLNKKMLAVHVNNENGELKEYCLVNPKIISQSVKLAYLGNGEGCLSVDKDHKGYVYRHYKITVRAYDLLTDKQGDFVFTGYVAIVLQHEIDHLDGILYYDRINKINPFEKRPNSVEF